MTGRTGTRARQPDLAAGQTVGPLQIVARAPASPSNPTTPRWRVRCRPCGRTYVLTSNGIHRPDRGPCRTCADAARRVPDQDRICRHCGRPTGPHGRGHGPFECQACNRQACRNGRAPDRTPLQNPRGRRRVGRLDGTPDRPDGRQRAHAPPATTQPPATGRPARRRHEAFVRITADQLAALDGLLADAPACHRPGSPAPTRSSMVRLLLAWALDRLPDPLHSTTT